MFIPHFITHAQYIIIFSTDNIETSSLLDELIFLPNPLYIFLTHLKGAYAQGWTFTRAIQHNTKILYEI